MEKRRIGSLEVTVAGLGCNNFGWRIGYDDAEAVVHAALDAGINFFDTSDSYAAGQSEQFLGRALGPRRSEAVIATKFGSPWDGHSGGAKPAYIKQSVEESLSRLGTDRIDLYQIHRPDPSTPIAYTLGALDELVRAGKVREIGCSNFSAEQIREAEAAVRPGAARFVSVQNEYSLMHRAPEADVIPECLRFGLAFLPYFPLANGLLTGKYRLGSPFPKQSRAADAFGPKVFTEANLKTIEALIAFAESRGHTILELAISWLLAQPAVASVIAGARTPEQVRANAAAIGWRLSPADLTEVNAILLNGA